MVSTKILPSNLLNAVKRSRPAYAIGRRARFALGSRLGARYIEGLGGKAHFNDFMLSSANDSQVASYKQGAQDFVRILGRSLTEAGKSWTDVRACLEVGCGYGRIVRELCPVLPAEAISVCDVIDEGARFTAAEFGVRKVPVVEAMDASYDASFDLTYLLSVYTHLSRPLIEANLARVTKLMKPGGVLVFTTHGKQSAETAERYEQYWLDKAKVNEVLDRDGFYYERYPYYYAEYGLTWILADEVRRLVETVAPELEFVAHHAFELDAHQDIFVYRRR